MFDELSPKLNATLQKLTGRGVLTEEAVKEGLREIRRILLEADVSFDLTREFLERVQAKAVGIAALKEVRPGHQIVKIVYDELVVLLGEKQAPIAHATVPPTIIMLVGLQGSGKTTTAGKLAKRLKLEQKAPFLVAADVYRPAAVDQLQTLGRQIDVGVYAEPGSKDVAKLVRQGIVAAGKARARTVIVDTAGRLQIDDEMMDELGKLKAAVSPHEILLVADGMTGQDAVRIAKGFHDALGITGVILTKMDGDARGGAALSIYGVTKAPIKYIGVGEKLDALEPFYPDRLAGRILQQGDILSLVEKAQGAVDEKEAERLAKKVTSKKGLDLEDFLGAMRQMQKMGPLKNVLGMLPGMNPAMLQAAKIDDKKLKHVEAIVLSMTAKERSNPDVLNGQRRLRIAKGSGRTVQEVNSLFAQFKQMQKFMKIAGKTGGAGLKLPFGRGRFPRLTRTPSNDQELTWQLAFASAVSAAKSSRSTGSWSPTRKRPVTGGSSRSSAPTTRRVPRSPTRSRWTPTRRASGSPRARRRPTRCSRSSSRPGCSRPPRSDGRRRPPLRGGPAAQAARVEGRPDALPAHRRARDGVRAGTGGVARGAGRGGRGGAGDDRAQPLVSPRVAGQVRRRRPARGARPVAGAVPGGARPTSSPRPKATRSTCTSSPASRSGSPTRPRSAWSARCTSCRRG